MSYCSHSLLDFDPKIGLYRCRDCPIHFEARAIHGQWPSQPSENKAPNRLLPIVSIGAGLVFALAVLFMIFKLQMSPQNPFSDIVPCQDSSEWKKEAQDARKELTACLKKPPKVKIVELPCPEVPECPSCPEIPDIVVPECPAIPPCPQYDPPQCPECEECSRSYESEFQQCMGERGDALHRLRESQKAVDKCQMALKGSKRKIEELRGVISRLTLGQGQKCPDVDVSVPQRGCEKEIEAACGNLREALDFYFKKSKSQPGAESDEGLPAYFGPRAIFQEDDEDEAFKELDLDSE